VEPTTEPQRAVSSFETGLIEQIPRLRRYARALTGDAGRADDLVQDCLERAWSRMHRWRAGSDLRAWLFTIMHNLHVNQVRYAARRQGQVPLDDHDGPVADGHLEGRLVDEIEAGLAGLPVEQREVLLLVALEGLRYEEVAAVLEIPLGTVMSRLYRARERMRRWLDGERPARLVRVK